MFLDFLQRTWSPFPTPDVEDIKPRRPRSVSRTVFRKLSRTTYRLTCKDNIFFLCRWWTTTIQLRMMGSRYRLTEKQHYTTYHASISTLPDPETEKSQDEKPTNFIIDSDQRGSTVLLGRGESLLSPYQTVSSPNSTLTKPPWSL